MAVDTNAWPPREERDDERRGLGVTPLPLKGQSYEETGDSDAVGLARAAVDQARDLLGMDGATLFRWDAEAEVLFPLANNDPRIPEPTPVMRPGQGATGEAFKRHVPLVVMQYRGWEQATTWGQRQRPESVVAVPILLDGCALGVLVTQCYSPRTVTAEEVRLQAQIAARIAPAVESMRLYAAAERRRVEAEALAEMVRQGAAEPEAERVMSLITAHAGLLLGADYAAVALRTEGESLTWEGTWGNHAESWPAPQLSRGLGALIEMLSRGDSVLLDRLGENPSYPLDLLPVHREEGGRTALVIPLMSREQVLGALMVGWRADIVLSAPQRRLAETLASYAATIIDNARARASATARAAELAASEARYRQMFETNRSVKLLIDPDSGRIVDANQAACTFYGYSKAEITALSIGAINTLSEAEIREEMAEAAHQDRLYFNFRHRMASGEVRAVEVYSGPVVVGAQTLLYSIIHDITERKKAEEALHHRALHDSLTNLPNRTLLQDRLQQALLAVQREQQSMALLLLDLDRFKEVNDTHGHRYGDLLLQQVAARLRGTLRATDTVARLGGDEFAVVLPGDDRAGAVRAAHKVLAMLDEPFLVKGQVAHIGASIGVALAPLHSGDAEALLRQADVAMYVAKRARSGYAIYTPEQDQHSPDRLALRGDLRSAIDHGELVLHYQPTVELASGRVIGVEALVRWRHPRHGLVPPDQFIAVAEQTGLIVPLTRCVLREALRQCGAWRQAGLSLSVSVNLSAWDLHDPTLPETIAALLREYEVPPALLRLELTESTLMENVTRTMEVLSGLGELGVRACIDDFGTGYSSLAYLKRLPTDVLKIDRSFVQQMTDDETDAAIVASTIGLGHSLGLRVVAEGVESVHAWQMLAAFGCDAAQGYYLSRPLPATRLTRWLRAAPYSW